MTKTAQIITRDDASWSPDGWHGRREERGLTFRRWRITDDGVQINDADAPVERTKGSPITITRIVDSYGALIDRWSTGVFQLDPRIVAAFMATESGGRPEAERDEPHIHDRSIGLMQTLTNTAAFMYRNRPTIRQLFPEMAGLLPEPKGGSVEVWRAILREPNTSIGLGCAVLDTLAHQLPDPHRRDPVLLYCAYNAGGVYEKDDDPWGLRNYDPDGRGPRPGALDGFCRWYGDACAVLR